MKRFAYLQAKTLPAASAALAAREGALAKGGGTDLLDLLKERVVEPDELVNLLGAERAAGPNEVSALATLAELAAHPHVTANFPALAQAAGEAATPQLRNVGTVGGNLCQHSRCWYLRNPGYACFKRGTPQCAAVQPDAENQYHAVLGVGVCACAHPSNLAPALIATGGKLALVGPKGERVIEAEALYRAPQFGDLSDTTLARGELIRALVLEPSGLAKRSVYREVRERQSFDFALASVAAAVDLGADGKVRAARVVCGAVASTPHRSAAAEEVLAGETLDGALAAKAAEEAVAAARPLAKNGYKIDVLKVLIRRALEALA